MYLVCPTAGSCCCS